jgi:hypothetical protein
MNKLRKNRLCFITESNRKERERGHMICSIEGKMWITALYCAREREGDVMKSPQQHGVSSAENWSLESV